MPRKKRLDVSSNSRGANQYRGLPILEEIPDLQEILQGYITSNVKQADIPHKLEKDKGVRIGLRTVQKYMKDLGVVTTCRNGLNDEQKNDAVELISQDDPLGRWGGRLVKEKLTKKMILIPRDEVLDIRRQLNPEATSSRHPATRKVHSRGLWSIGPNEEWCVDGHEKILGAMGIAVWGVIDKYSRMELGLWVMPNARVQALPPALFLRVVKERGGMPLTTTSDKGTEVGLLISLVTTMRNRFQPFVPEEKLPAFKAVKSVFNITRERAWRPLWEKELGNVLYEYNTGRLAAGFVESDSAHIAISRWLWGRIVQDRLDEIRQENETHKIRKQKKILLPSGARRIDLYSSPKDYGNEDWLIKIPSDTINELLTEYDRPDLLLFGSSEDIALCEKLYRDIGSPSLCAKIAWKVFTNMVTAYIETCA